jgi:phage I-like protein
MNYKVFVLKELFALKSKSDDAKDENAINIVGVVGSWEGHPSGAFKLTAIDLQKMVENFDALARDIVVDYEHRTLYGEEAPAAGWVKKLEVQDEKLCATIEWTEKAKGYIVNGEYRYLSPVFSFYSVDAKSGAPIGVTLHSIALTNSPFLDELGEVVANTIKETKMAEGTKTKEQELSEELELAKTRASEAKVENAILCKKLSEQQKIWALKYAKDDPVGFDAYLETIVVKKEVVADKNIFANKKKAGQTDEDFVIAAALRV